MHYYCTSNRYVFNPGTNLETQSAELHSLVNFPVNAEESFLSLNRAVHINKAPKRAYYYGVKRAHERYEQTWTVSWNFKNAKGNEISTISVIAFTTNTKWVLKANGVESDLTQNQLNTINIEKTCDEFSLEATFGRDSEMFHQHFSRDDPCLVIKLDCPEPKDKSFKLDSADYEVVYTARNDMYYINGREEPRFDSRALTNSYGPQINYIAENSCVGKEENDFIPRKVSWSFCNPNNYKSELVLVYFQEEKIMIERYDHHVDWTLQIDEKFLRLKPNEYNLVSVLHQ